MAEAKAAEKPKKEKKRGIGDAAMEAIKAGKTNEEALAAVKQEFPGGKTSLSSINWYRNKMRQSDPSIKSARELKKAAAGTKDGGKKDPLE